MIGKRQLAYTMCGARIKFIEMCHHTRHVTIHATANGLHEAVVLP